MTQNPTTIEKSKLPKSPGFWQETWSRFRRRPTAMLALAFVAFLALVAIFAPAIAGTKPVVCKYKGHLYFPALGYFNSKWENTIFMKDRFRKRYTPELFKEKDPDSWVVWPLVYQDPTRRVMANEWPDQPANPIGAEGKPSWQNLFGTNQQGIDVFAMMVHGTRIALLVGFVSMGIAASIGIVSGALAGYFGGWIDIIISRIIEVVLCIPSLALILACIAIVPNPTIWLIMAVIGFTRWTDIARLTRAEFLRLKEADYVMAAKSLGAGQFRIIFKHILRNGLAPVLVPITFGIAAAILIESGLALLGVSTSSSGASWGSVLREGRSTIEQTWWLIFFPGMAIFLTVLAYNLIGEGLQEATDPRLRSDN